MNGLEEIQIRVKRIKELKFQEQQKISEIEEKRNELASKRNEIKKQNPNDSDVIELGKQIAKLGNESQELQNKLDSACCAIKNEVNLIVTNLVSEGIRKIRKVDFEIQELKEKVETQNEKNVRYKIQKQEFYARFGRMPELSENAVKNFKENEKEKIRNLREISKLKIQVENIKEEIANYANIKQQFKNGNYGYILPEKPEEKIEIKEMAEIVEEPEIEELYIEEEPIIEEFYVEDVEPIEEIVVEDIIVEAFKEEKEENTVTIENMQESSKDENSVTENIEELQKDEVAELAKQIVEKIVSEQTNTETNTEFDKIEEIEENDENPEDIISFEIETGKIEGKKEKPIIALFGQRAKISNIIIKFEEGELVYKAQMTDDEEIKIYPSQINEEGVILRDKQNRKECEQILINYSISEEKVLDKKVVKYIDPLVCELLIECAEQYGYDAQELVYNYAMSFSRRYEVNTDAIPNIIYNISYIEQSKLNKKERNIVNRTCKNAIKNIKIDVIESMSGFKKIKYVLKRLFAINNVKVLSDAK